MSVVCPYDGLIFESEIEYQTHFEQEHAGLPPMPSMPVPETPEEWEALQTAIIVNNQNATSFKSVLESREEALRPSAESEYEKGKDGLIGFGGELSKTLSKAELEAEWNRNQVLALGINGVAIAAQAGILFGGALPFLSTSYAMSQIYNMPFVRAATGLAADFQMFRYNTVSRPLMQRYLLGHAMPYLPEAYRLALAVSKGIIDDSTYETAMAQSGLAIPWAHMWKEENYQYPTFSTLFNMLWRGAINVDTFKLWLRRQGYKEETVLKLLEIKDVIPPLDDLIRFAVREAYGEHKAEEQYPTYEAWAQKMGLSKEFAENYWYAHWDRIPLTQLYENLWRKDNFEDTFKRYLKIKDIHEDDWQLILDVAYRPPGIREMGYGWDTGKYTMDDIVKYRRMEGLSTEDAEKAAASLIDYRLEAEREALRREWMHLYALGRLSEEDFAKNLEAVFDMNSRTELWIERGKLEAQRIAKEGSITEPRIITGAEAIWAFKAGLRTEEWLRGALDALEWDNSRIELAVERAKLEMVVVPEPEKPVEYRQLSITQIQSLYALGTIDYDMLRLELETIGYSPDDATRLADLTVIELEAKPSLKTWSRADLADMYDLAVIDEDMLYEELLNLGYDEYHAAGLTLYVKVAVNLPDIKARYSKGWIDEQTLYYELLNLWYPDVRAEELSRTLLSEELRKLWTPEARATTLFQTIVAVEKPARTMAEKDLTKAEIIKGAKSGVLTVKEATDLLIDIGYDSDEAQYLLMVNAVVMAGDPESYWEMKRITEQYKKAQGLPWKEVPQELITWEKQYKALQAEVEKLKKEGATDEVLSDALLRLSAVEATYTRLIAAWNTGQT